MTFETSQLPLFDEMELPLMSSAAASHVRTYPPLADALALKVRDLVSGRSMQGSLANFDHASSSWRTCQACLVSGWEPFSGSFPRSGMMLAGTAYQLPPSAPLTAETASGLWPTPVRHDDGKTPEAHLAMKARMKGGPRKTITSLAVMARATTRGLWPTPTRGAALCEWGGSGSREKLRTMVTPEELYGALNPTWVEWLMGFPLGWTALELWETRSSRKSSKSSAERSL